MSTQTLLRNLRTRSALLRAVRDFFYAGEFLEIETPVKIPAPAPEEYIESVTAGQGEFLRTSPELAMKELLSLGVEKMFQIGSAFRAGEFGRKHREEFTILEYYAAGWDYKQLADFTARMMAFAAREVIGRTDFDFDGRHFDLSQVEYITVDEAFRKYAGVSAFDADKDDSFDELMVLKVEPQLGKEGITFLCDYPAKRASLSRLSAADPLVAERWEVYVGGIELGNAFGELTDGIEQRRRFEEALAFRAEQGMLKYPEPTAFYAALDRGLPASSGCAIGFDRLTMLITGSTDISEVRFC